MESAAGIEAAGGGPSLMPAADGLDTVGAINTSVNLSAGGMEKLIGACGVDTGNILQMSGTNTGNITVDVNLGKTTDFLGNVGKLTDGIDIALAGNAMIDMNAAYSENRAALNDLRAFMDSNLFNNLTYEEKGRVWDAWYEATATLIASGSERFLSNSVNGCKIVGNGILIGTDMAVASMKNAALKKLADTVGVIKLLTDVADVFLKQGDFEDEAIRRMYSESERIQRVRDFYYRLAAGRNRKPKDEDDDYDPDREDSDYDPNWTYDPAGFAWSGTEDGKLAGVTAELWTADDESGANARFWSEAPEYDQVNPQTTEDDGYYAWDTPTGWWQVRLRKDGYSSAQSAWLPVLPIQLGVNLEMKNLAGGDGAGGGGAANPPSAGGGSASISPSGGGAGAGAGGGSGGSGGAGAEQAAGGGKTMLLGGNTVTTPEGQDPAERADGSFALPGGGTVATPGGTVIAVPAGTAISGDGRTIALPNGWLGASVRQGGRTATVDPGLTIEITDNAATAGGYSVYWANPFSDVRESDWFYGDALYAYTRGLMAGTGADAFSPGAALTRGMIATVLHRHAGGSGAGGTGAEGAGTGAGGAGAGGSGADGTGAGGASAGESGAGTAGVSSSGAGESGAGNSGADGTGNPFSDIGGGEYYADAVKWAAANGIVDGVGGGRFDPEAPIARQDLAAMLNRYADFAGMGLPAARAQAAFADGADIAGYALEAVEKLSAAMIIEGRGNGVFDPKGTATRAEVAAMLRRLLEAAGKGE
jgi:hypothetical protein